MRRGFVSPISGFAFFVGIAITNAAPPPAIFAEPVPTTQTLESGWRELPPNVRPASDLQKLLAKVHAGEPVESWRVGLEEFAKIESAEPVSVGVRELAKCWMARAAMAQIDSALRLFYRREVRFPDNLGAVEKEIPAPAKSDPWGEPWIYKPVAPKPIAKWTKQRYELGPTRAPHLSTLEEARLRKPALPVWKITPREIGGSKALDLRSGNAQAVVQPGGRFGDATLLFIGDGWALFADTERLFTLTF